MRKAVYAGTFDPITLGHWYMVETGVGLFDELVIAVAVNPTKNPWFTTDERIGIIQACVDGFASRYRQRVQVDVIQRDKYLVNYAEEKGAQFILRGLRSEQDFDYEQTMRQINRDIKPYVETVFLMPPRELSEVSSSMVKGLVGPDGWQDIVRKYLPTPVYEAVLKKAVK